MGKVIYEEYTGTQVPSSWVVHQSDDAWHPLKDKYYIEWWYFDLVTGTGALSGASCSLRVIPQGPRE